MTTDMPSDSSLRKTVDTHPTPAQADAGNYRKGHVTFGGLDISIENPRGSVRSGTSKAGKEWSITLKHHYGYIKRTTGKDKDHVDVFIGPNQAAFMVYVVDQVDPSSGKFDEHKVMLGFGSKEDARAGYLANYENGWKGLGQITSTSLPKFKQWLKDGDTTKPFADLTKSAQDARGNTSGFLNAAQSVQVPATAGYPIQGFGTNLLHNMRADWGKQHPVLNRIVGQRADSTLHGLGRVYGAFPKPTQADLDMWAKKRWLQLRGNKVNLTTQMSDLGDYLVNRGHMPVDTYNKLLDNDPDAAIKALRTFQQRKLQLKTTISPPPAPKPIVKTSEEKTLDTRKHRWVGIDLDGTLAEYHGFKGPHHIGPPIPKMVARVKRWLADGKDIRIFTARADLGDKALQKIKDWCKEHIGEELPITNVKDRYCEEIWDDRAVRVKKNDGAQVNKNAEDEHDPRVYNQAAMTKTVPLKVCGEPDHVKAYIQAEIADTPAARAKGMAKHAQVPDYGMFFDMPGPFWMKGMRFPLDVAFLDKTGRVVDMQHMPVSHAPDFLKARYASRDPAAVSALETPAGWFKQAGVQIGDHIDVAPTDWHKQAAGVPTGILTRFYSMLRHVPQWLGGSQTPLFGRAIAQRAAKHGLTTLVNTERTITDPWNVINRARGHIERYATSNWLPREAGKHSKGVLLNLAGYEPGSLVAKRMGKGVKVIGTNVKNVFKDKMDEALRLRGIIPDSVDIGRIMREERIRAGSADAGTRLYAALRRRLGSRFILKPKGGYATPGGSLPTEKMDPQQAMRILRGRAGDANVINYATTFKGPHTYMAQKRLDLQKNSLLERMIDAYYGHRVGGDTRLGAAWNALRTGGATVPNMSVGGSGVREWRVHTLNGKVIPYATTGRGSTLGMLPFWNRNRAQAEAAVNRALRKMPKSLSRHGYGFDVAKTRDGRFVILESNPAEITGASGLLDAPHLADAVSSAVLGKMPAYIRLQRQLQAGGAVLGTGGAAAGLTAAMRPDNPQG